MLKFTSKDFKTLPWKNGGGRTLELFKQPHLRLSLATVAQDGPFSLFENIDRHLVLLKGNGIELTFPDGKIQKLENPYQVLRFKGEDQIHCRLLNGISEDFNIMVDRSWGKADLQVKSLVEGQKLHLEKCPLMFIYQIQAQVLLELKAEAMDLEFPGAMDLLIIKIRQV
ncbi:MAG TPA: HutD family protein [Bacteriovoracaceae bacterium]|nr:HutD family protein [Bacteriovoracaceae bacterium]